MTTHPGLIHLDDHDVPVTVGLNNGIVRLLADDIEIGEWSRDDCIIRSHEDGRWLIEAEGESLPFLPTDPDLFSRSLSLDSDHGDRPSSAVPEMGPTEGPPAKPLTLVGFYLIAAMTTALGVWAFISLLG